MAVTHPLSSLPPPSPFLKTHLAILFSLLLLSSLFFSYLFLRVCLAFLFPSSPFTFALFYFRLFVSFLFYVSSLFFIPPFSYMYASLFHCFVFLFVSVSFLLFIRSLFLSIVPILSSAFVSSYSIFILFCTCFGCSILFIFVVLHSSSASLISSSSYVFLPCSSFLKEFAIPFPK